MTLRDKPMVNYTFRVRENQAGSAFIEKSAKFAGNVNINHREHREHGEKWDLFKRKRISNPQHGSSNDQGI